MAGYGNFSGDCGRVGTRCGNSILEMASVINILIKHKKILVNSFIMHNDNSKLFRNSFN